MWWNLYLHPMGYKGETMRLHHHNTVVQLEVFTQDSTLRARNGDRVMVICIVKPHATANCWWIRLFWRCSKIYKNNKHNISVAVYWNLFYSFYFRDGSNRRWVHLESFQMCIKNVYNACSAARILVYSFWAQKICQLTRLLRGPTSLQCSSAASACSIFTKLRWEGLEGGGDIKIISSPDPPIT